MTSYPSPENDNSLPPHLKDTQVLEMEQLPMQVLLLTLEVAQMRQRLDMLAKVLEQTGKALRLPTYSL